MTANVNDQLDELLASFDSPNVSTSSPASVKRESQGIKILPLDNILPDALQALDDFDFLDNFLAEMEEEKKTKSPVVGGAPKTLGPPKPAPTRTSSARPSTRADAFLSELEDMVNEKRTFPHNYLFIHRYSDDYFFKI